MNTYDSGDVVRLTAALTNSAGVAVDPSSLFLRYRGPTGDVTTLAHPASITKINTGNYYAELQVNTPGDWAYRWEALGSNQAASPSTPFEVRFRDPF
jgi:hypothetical protein